MTEHYYSKQPQAKSLPQSWSFDLRGRTFQFTSDVGVFSKSEVDFGSRVLIESFQEPEVDGPILDVGCGYGPIGLSLASDFSDRHIFMVDVNERAVELAQKNAEINKISNTTILQSDLYQQLNEKTFASIVTNPPIRAGKKVVHAIFEEAWGHLSNHGDLWAVIQKKQGAPSAKGKLEEVFGNVEVVVKKKGYFILRAKKFD
ncbi:Ribosomal RNA large subunit methyltransferase G [Oceanobacillus oncorhynchi]|uniref:Ribosomal RNA large subunit methyltransferase G n=1 Tax=Oceanobacillus oncorhynchi TaxID=545501 RepID=A0A0A1MPI6_9BACI|nr:class I SAM-dependent methyltransferase [Oceanobacillus oncorhynchi]CEI81552.1 Ribosomal RNA large subunit methyltransferase G [Oceanobacillus oncorhynchi]